MFVYRDIVLCLYFLILFSYCWAWGHFRAETFGQRVCRLSEAWEALQIVVYRHKKQFANAAIALFTVICNSTD